MSIYEKHLAADKAAIRARVVEIGHRVEAAVGQAVRSLLHNDRELCATVVLGDLPINRDSRALDRQCHAFVARHLPSAGHLRFVSSAMQLNVALERIGDYAVTIAREAIQLSGPPPKIVETDILRLEREACQMLGRALRAFEQSDAELARETKPEAASVERTYDEIFHDLLQASGLPLRDLFALLTVFNKLERVSDQAKNICEETLFELTGETKPPKVYRVLFVDARDSLLAPLAVALARKAFPESGRYDHGGWQPAEALAPELSSISDELGLDLTGLAPRKLAGAREALRGYHVVVGLQAKAHEHLTVPFHSVLLQWELPGIADGSVPEAGLREVARHLSGQLRELMVTLRGEDAC